MTFFSVHSSVTVYVVLRAVSFREPPLETNMAMVSPSFVFEFIVASLTFYSASSFTGGPSYQCV